MLSSESFFCQFRSPFPLFCKADFKISLFQAVIVYDLIPYSIDYTLTPTSFGDWKGTVVALICEVLFLILGAMFSVFYITLQVWIFGHLLCTHIMIWCF